MDLTDSIAPKSDQLNADDMISGPRTFTIERVDPGSSEQPVNIYLVEAPGHPYRPSKSMRRVLVFAWGKDTTNYPGRRITLYRDPTVKFGGMEVGGIKISHLSHIDKTMKLALTETRGKRGPHVVEPMPNTPQTPRGESPSRTAVGLAGPSAEVEGPGATTPDAPRPEDPIPALMERAGITEKEHARAYVSDVIGREVTSRAELTATETITLVEALTQEVGKP